MTATGAFIAATGAFIDPTADLHPSVVVWHFARVLAGAKIGPGVSIGGGCEIGRDSIIGADSRIGANCFLPSRTLIGRRVFVGPNVVCTDDRHPFVRGLADRPYHAEPPVFEDDVSVGAGVVILPGVRLGAGCKVGAGAVVLDDVPPNATIVTEALTRVL